MLKMQPPGMKNKLINRTIRVEDGIEVFHKKALCRLGIK